MKVPTVHKSLFRQVKPAALPVTCVYETELFKCETWWRKIKWLSSIKLVYSVLVAKLKKQEAKGSSARLTQQSVGWWFHLCKANSSTLLLFWFSGNLCLEKIMSCSASLLFIFVVLKKNVVATVCTVCIQSVSKLWKCSQLIDMTVNTVI